MNEWIKVIASGHVIEVYTYEKMPRPSKQKSDKKEKSDLEWIEDVAGDRKQNQRKKRWNLIRLLNQNFDAGSKFITLTFAENMTDLDQAHLDFKKFILRMRYEYGNFKYGCVVEFQKRGAVHYHMLSDLPYIPKDDLAKIWRQGFVRINRIEHVDNVGAYVSKYMTKEEADLRLRGRKTYFTSKNLDRPIELKGQDADAIIRMYELEQKKAVFESCYDSEHHGEIKYRQYNLKRV